MFLFKSSQFQEETTNNYKQIKASQYMYLEQEKYARLRFTV